MNPRANFGDQKAIAEHDPEKQFFGFHSRPAPGVVAEIMFQQED
jgi:hypothetical protein